jgi:hypothetical protein
MEVSRASSLAPGSRLRPKPQALLTGALSDLDREDLADGALQLQEMMHEPLRGVHELPTCCTNGGERA